MAIIREIKGHFPSISDTCWVADNATITGNTSIGEASSIWYNSVIRGYVNIIKIGNQVNDLKAQGAEIANLTIGDLNSNIYPIPAELKEEIQKAYQNFSTVTWAM